MLLYCIITWLMGIGMAYTFEKQDKKKGKKSKIPPIISIPLFALIMPVVLPVGLGIFLGDCVEDKD